MPGLPVAELAALSADMARGSRKPAEENFAVLLVFVLAASNFFPARLSKPVEQLAEDSAQNLALPIGKFATVVAKIANTSISWRSSLRCDFEFDALENFPG